MASKLSREQWRTQVERYLASDMSVAEWCRVNRLSESSMFKWIGHFADREPELFGGPQNIEDRDRCGWIGKTRENMRASAALGCRADPAPGGGFLRIDAASLASFAGPSASAPGPSGAGFASVELNGAVVRVPAGFPARDVAAVLEAVASL